MYFERTNYTDITLTKHVVFVYCQATWYGSIRRTWQRNTIPFVTVGLPGEQCNVRMRARAFTYNIARRHPYMQRQDGLIHYSLVYNKFQCKSCKYDLWNFCFDTFSISPHPCLSVVEVCFVCMKVFERFVYEDPININ